MDFSHFYRNNVKVNFEQDRAAIAAGFSEIIDRGIRTNFRVVTYYKGLPISYPAIPVEMHQGTLELDINQQQAAALEGSLYAFIKCDYFDRSILAEIREVNVPRMTASFRNFSFVEILAERRTALRLELMPQTDAEIVAGSTVIPGKLRDVSLGGFSVFHSDPSTVEDGTEVVLRVVLPNLLQGRSDTIETGAQLVETIHRDGYDICRFSFQPDQNIENLISRFIFQRQVEIIKELKERS